MANDQTVSVDLRVWKCKNGHVLGQVRRSGQGVHQLLIYRHAVSFETGKPEEVDIMGVAEGTVMEIKCDICGEVRTWETGAVALEKLLKSYSKLVNQSA